MICELVDEESKLMVFKSINELAPQNLQNLIRRHSIFSSHTLRNTASDLMIPKKTSNNGQKMFLVLRCETGIANQLRQSSRFPFEFSKKNRPIEWTVAAPVNMW